MIGKVGIFTSPFFDKATGQNAFKERPALIIANATSGDYTVLPVSRVTNRKYLDIDYDIPVTLSAYPNLNLHCSSYVRVHKQTSFSVFSLHKTISDMKVAYPDLYVDIIGKLEEYYKRIVDNAL